VRGSERIMQGLRKEEGLKVGQWISPTYLVADPDWAKAIEKIDKNKTYVSEIFRADNENDPRLKDAKEVELDGKKGKISLAKVDISVVAKAEVKMSGKVIRKDGRTEELESKKSSSWISKMLGR